MAPPYVRSYLLVLILDAEIGLLVQAPCLSRGTRKHHCRIPNRRFYWTYRSFAG